MFPAASSHNPNKDCELSQPPEDSISKVIPPAPRKDTFIPYQIAFSPNSNYLIGSTWNNVVRCWELQETTGASAAKAEQQHTGPVLDCCWVSVSYFKYLFFLFTRFQQDGTKVLSASCDKTCKLWDLQSNQAIDIGSV